MPGFKLIEPDLSNARQATDLTTLLSEYAVAPTGGRQALSENVKRDLIPELQKRPTAFILLA